jgi:MFS family permease
MLARLKQIYHEYPKNFWVIVGVSFIDRVGGTLLFPFFSLYLTQKFGIGMTQAGFVLGLFALFGLFGGAIGGALTDKFGRKKLILFGLIFSAISTLGLGLINEFAMLIPMAILVGLLSDVAGPAHSAMIADILPDSQRAEGFGLLRVVGNLAWIIGPTIGGFVANYSFLALFILDAIISCIVAFLFFLLMPETKPQAAEGSPHESILSAFRGYGQVIKDHSYMAFLFAAILMGLVYQQMYNSLSVYLRDAHGISTSGYGFLLTTSAIVVILLQFWVTRRIKERPPFLFMALGTVFYAIGFSMFGFVSSYWLFMSAIIIITIGEMVIMPISQALAANFAPAEMRGRYMAAFGLSWMLPATIGPSMAGYVLDNFNPNLLWYIGGILCLFSTFFFYVLHRFIGKQARFLPPKPEKPTEISASQPVSN